MKNLQEGTEEHRQYRNRIVRERQARVKAIRMEIDNEKLKEILIEVPPVEQFPPERIMSLLPTIKWLNMSVGNIPTFSN
jgi:hypothetical protein